MWTRIHSKITSSKFWPRIRNNARSFLGRVEKISPVEVYIVIFVAAATTFAFHYSETQNELTRIKLEVTSSQWINNQSQYDGKAPFWLSEQLEVGQKERTPRGRLVAEIVGLENYERGNDQSEIYLVVELMADYNSKNQSYSFEGTPLATGETMSFVFNNVLVEGQILDHDYPQQGYDQGVFEVQVLLRDVEPWRIEQLEVGKTMKNRATGEVIAELKDFTLKPSTRAVATDLRADGNLVVTSNKDNRDVEAIFELKAEKVDGHWFFAGHQRLRVGTYIWFYLPQFVFSGAEIQRLEYQP